jgi:hypothetical protein
MILTRTIRQLAVFIILVTFVPDIRSADRGASVPPLSQLKQICASLVDEQMLSKNWYRLRPYLQNSHDLDAPAEVFCGATCRGSFDLRGGYESWKKRKRKGSDWDCPDWKREKGSDLNI